MTTAARLGYGTKLKMGDGATPTEAFTEIAEIKSLEDSDSAEQVEVTNHQSAGSRREYINGLIDGDEITFTVNYDPDGATHNNITGLRSKVGGAAVNFQLEEPGNTLGMQFAALVMSCGRSYPVDAAMEMQVTLKKTGAVTTYTVS
jgi:predicted secreted protein